MKDLKNKGFQLINEENNMTRGARLERSVVCKNSKLHFFHFKSNAVMNAMGSQFLRLLVSF